MQALGVAPSYDAGHKAAPLMVLDKGSSSPHIPYPSTRYSLSGRLHFPWPSSKDRPLGIGPPTPLSRSERVFVSPKGGPSYPILPGALGLLQTDLEAQHPQQPGTAGKPGAQTLRTESWQQWGTKEREMGRGAATCPLLDIPVAHHVLLTGLPRGPGALGVWTCLLATAPKRPCLPRLLGAPASGQARAEELSTLGRALPSMGE